jgi:hypothetical protein
MKEHDGIMWLGFGWAGHLGYDGISGQGNSVCQWPLGEAEVMDIAGPVSLASTTSCATHCAVALLGSRPQLRCRTFTCRWLSFVARDCWSECNVPRRCGSIRGPRPHIRSCRAGFADTSVQMQGLRCIHSWWNTMRNAAWRLQSRLRNVVLYHVSIASQSINVFSLHRSNPSTYNFNISST